jgi:hypothetical protein
MNYSLYRILLLSMILLTCARMQANAQILTVERHGDFLRITAPQLHFLSGKALERLHDGSTVNYVMKLTVAAAHYGKPAFTLQERFSVSYDLWEEKYSVVPSRADGRGASRLSAAMMEAWLLEAVTIPIRSIPEQHPFQIHLECYADIAEIEAGEKRSAGLTLAGLIDVLSRKDEEKPQFWKAATTRLRLNDLKNNK